MEKFKKYLEDKDFDGAIKFLKSSKDIELPIKYYNLGYVYSEKSDFVNARYYFEKAKAEGFINQKLNNSLKIVKENLGVEQVESDYSYLDKVVLSAANFRDEVYFSIIGIILLVGLVGFIKSRKILVGVCVTFCCLIGASLIVFKSHNLVILQKEAYIYEGPSRIFEPSQLISPGSKVMIGEEKKDWKYVSYPRIYRGWIYKVKVRKI